jgi:hypothetical protein
MMKQITVAAFAGALALSAFSTVPAQAAPAAQPQAKPVATVDLSARSRHHHYRRHGHYRHYRHYGYRHHGGSRAGLYMFGTMMGMIGSMAAADQCRRYGSCYGYAPRYYRPYYYPY